MLPHGSSRPQAVDWRRKLEILQMERNRTRQLLRSLTGMTTTGHASLRTSLAGSSLGALTLPSVGHN
jgi:hypothetical protein